MEISPESRPERAPSPKANRAAHGAISDVVRAMADLPRAAKAMSRLVEVILLQHNALTRENKDSIESAVAAASGSSMFHLLDYESQPLLAFSEKLVRYGPCISGGDIDALRVASFSNPAILETIAAVALSKMLGTIIKAVRSELGGGESAVEPSEDHLAPAPGWNNSPGPFLRTDATLSDDLVALLRPQYGFVPKFLMAQGQWPELVRAQVQALESIVFCEDHLSRIQKECILFAVSAKNLSTYGVALHGQVLAVLGTSAEDCEAILGDLATSSFTSPEKVLLQQVSRLAGPRHSGSSNFDPTELGGNGYSRPQVLEAVATASLGNFFNTLQFGLGVPPDFPPMRVFSEKDLYLDGADLRPTSDVSVESDPDADLVAEVKAGQTDGFEDLIRRHSRRVFGTLNGILGNYEEARDATQDVFVRAFEHIGRFEGRAKFSTWITSIAVNTGTELLRRRRPNVPLEESVDEDFRPRQVQSWAKDPEAIFATGQVNTLVRDAVLRLPQKYRVAVLLRDINQIPTEDAAQALGLSVPALKARVLRGRLMLRERLAAHFTRRGSQDA